MVKKVTSLTNSDRLGHIFQVQRTNAAKKEDAPFGTSSLRMLEFVLITQQQPLLREQPPQRE